MLQKANDVYLYVLNFCIHSKSWNTIKKLN